MKPFYATSLCLLLICTLSGNGNSQPATPATSPSTSTVLPVPHAGREKDVATKMARFGKKHFDIVFDGDSIMNRWETTGKTIWSHHYVKIAADFGIEGDRVENVLWRLDQGQMDGIDPKVIVLMIGTNNSGRNSAAEIADGIENLVAEYERRCPQAHLILMGIFPRGEKPEDGGRRKVAAVNTRLRALVDSRVTYLDIGAQMIGPDGIISREMMPDFVHPTVKGYQIWADAIQPVINQYVPAN